MKHIFLISLLFLCFKLQAKIFFESNFQTDQFLDLQKNYGKTYQAKRIGEDEIQALMSQKWQWYMGDCEDNYWSVDFDKSIVTYIVDGQPDPIKMSFENNLYTEYVGDSYIQIQIYFIEELDYMVLVVENYFDEDHFVSKQNLLDYHSWYQTCEEPYNS